MRIVIRSEDKQLRAKARRTSKGLDVVVCDGWDVPEPTLFAGAGAGIPWELVGAGFGFLERWDAAAPLWRYGVLAEDLGGPAERARTEAIVRDLRIPVYAPELLFVAPTEAGRALVETWRAECADGEDERLAFVRALYLVKPRFCALPCTWVRDLTATPAAAPRAEISTGPRELVRVEICPGRSVQCRPEDVEKYRRRFEAAKYKR